MYVAGTDLWKYVHSPVSVWSHAGSKGRLVTYLGLVAGKKTQFLKASLGVFAGTSFMLFVIVIAVFISDYIAGIYLSLQAAYSLGWILLLSF